MELLSSIPFEVVFGAEMHRGEHQRLPACGLHAGCCTHEVAGYRLLAQPRDAHWQPRTHAIWNTALPCRRVQLECA
eukprot:430555-Pleurochrysis_carterae.AAC.1